MDTTRAVRTLLVLAVASAAVGCSGGAGESPHQAFSTSTAATASSAASPADPPTEVLSPLLQQALPNVADRTFTSAVVDFPPAARANPHRHGSAFVYAYVLDGTIRSRVTGRPAHTYRSGEDWVEQPGAHHVLTENLSTTEPARLLVVFISTTGDRLKIDDPAPAQP